MKTCSACKEPILDNAKFCPNCGASITGDAASEMKAQLETRTEGIFGKLSGEFQRVQFKVLFPFKAWWRDKPWNIRWVKWFIFFGLFPLGVAAFFSTWGGTLKDAGWFLGAYFALFWAFVLKFCISPEPHEKYLQVKIATFTLVFGVILVLVGQHLPLIDSIYSTLDSSSLWKRLLAFTFGVGFLEESVKAFPVFWFVYRRNKNYQPVTFAYLGCMSGLAFGLSEAVDYSLRYARGHLVGSMTYHEYIIIQVVRLVTLPLLHAAWTGTVGYFIGLAAMKPESSRALIVLGVGVTMVLHGVYDTFDIWVALAVATLSLLVFVAYLRTSMNIWKNLEKLPASPPGSPQSAAQETAP